MDSKDIDPPHRPARVTLTARDYVALAALLTTILGTFALPAGLWASSVSTDIKVIKAQHQNLVDSTIADLKRRVDRLEAKVYGQ